MNRYVLTGAPGAGKTAVIRQLECEGFGVVEEAATDIIALWQAKGIAEPSGLPPFRERRERNLRKETSSKEILLIDDEDNIRLTLSLILRERGFTVTAAGSVLDAKRILKVQDFDVLLCDLNIEREGDGFEVLQAMELERMVSGEQERPRVAA